MVKAFIFDLDGVITDTAPLHFAAWRKLAKEELGVVLHPSMNDRLKGLSRLDSLTMILETQRMEDDFSIAEMEMLAEKKNADYQERIATLTPDDILPGIVSLLDAIQGSGYLLGLASASHNAPTILQALDLSDYFHVIADPRTVKQGKPAPDIFLQAARKLCVLPEMCIGIEDAASGVEAIKRAHMFAVGVGDQQLLKRADFIVRSTADLTLEKLLAVWNTTQLK